MRKDKPKSGRAREQRYKCCGCIKHSKFKDTRQYDSIHRSDPVYMQHLQNLKRVVKIIDNNPPALSIDKMIRTDITKKGLYRMQEIGLENKSLLSRIDQIMRSTGRTVNYNPIAGMRRTQLHEWLDYMESIDKANESVYRRIMAKEATLKTSYLLECWQKNLIKIREKARHPLTLPGIMPADDGLGLEDCLDQFRPRAYFNIAVRDGRTLGKIVVVLYSDIAPTTTRNFIDLIQNYSKKERGKRVKDPTRFPHYTGTPVHRICPGLFIEMGDNTKGNGMGGASSFGKDFPQENFIQEAKYRGMLAMIPDAEGNVNSKFLITVKPLKVLNGKRTMFGRVVQGMCCVDIVEKLCRPNGSPMEPIIIAKCGTLKPVTPLTYRSCLH